MKSKGGPNGGNNGGGSNTPQPVPKPNPENQDFNQKYKTSLCRHFEHQGRCDLGEKCHFAHGKEELRKASDVTYFCKESFLSNLGSHSRLDKESIESGRFDRATEGSPLEQRALP